MPWKRYTERVGGTVETGWIFEKEDGESINSDIEDTYPGGPDGNWVVVHRGGRVCENCARDLGAVPARGGRSAFDLANVPQHPDDEINLGEPEPSRRRLEDTQQRIRQRINELQAQLAAEQKRMAEIEARLMQLGESPVHTSEHDEEPQ